MFNRVQRPYSQKEEKIILDFIIEQQAFNLLKTNSFWKQLESKNLLDRTYQSMKEHFRKVILLQLHYPFYELTPEIRQQITNGYREGYST